MSRRNVTFTVLIPCYGACKYLLQTIESILDQDYETRIVICAQGDTNVSHIIEKYPSIQVLRLEKPSLYKTRIFLFDKWESDYLYFVDDDDILPKGLFKYVNSIIQKTGYLDLYRIPLKEFVDNEREEKLRNQEYKSIYHFETKDIFLSNCFDGSYHNGVVHLFIKNGLHPSFFDVDVFQTEDRLITFSIVQSIATDVCVIEDAFYLYRKYPNSHSRSLDFLKGRDDFICVNNCLGKYMSKKDLIFNSCSIILRIVSYLKTLVKNSSFTKANFLKIYNNDGLDYYLSLFLENKKNYKTDVGRYVYLITKTITKKKFFLTKLLVKIKCFYEVRKYGKIQE